MMIFTNFNNNFTQTFTRIVITILLLTGVFSCDEKRQSASFSRMVERGYVTVGTLYGPNSFSLQGDEIRGEGYTGFEYELAKKYADYLNLKLKVVASYSLDELFIKLNTGEVDFLAAGLSITDKRLERFRFAPSYESVSQKLVFKQGNVRPRDIDDLTGTLMVTANSSHAENLQRLQQNNPDLTWIETSEFDSEELLIKLLEGEIDYTLIDSKIGRAHV